MSRHIPIAELAGAFFRLDDKIKALGMLKAYFDDSGTHGESLITAISGFLAPASVWKSVEDGWLDAMAGYGQYGIDCYHATDIENWRGQWAGAPRNVCRLAPMQFATVLSKHNILPVWAAVVNEDFKQYSTPESCAIFPTPFDVCFHEAMGQHYWWCKENLNATQVVPIVAHGDYVDRITKAHDRYLTDGDFPEYIGTLGIDHPHRAVPLQTADLLAYEFYHWWRDTEYGNPLKERPVLEKAIEHNKAAIRGACYSGKGAKTAIERHVESHRKREQGGRRDGEG
jgi:hypothetical protein